MINNHLVFYLRELSLAGGGLIDRLTLDLPVSGVNNVVWVRRMLLLILLDFLLLKLSHQNNLPLCTAILD